MRAFFKRFREGRTSPLEAELTAARSQPPARLVDSIVAMVRPRPAAAGARHSRLRLGYAGALTATIVAVVAATGGFAYAASAVSHVASAVHITNNSSKPAAAQFTAACGMYALAPTVTGYSPTSGPVGTTVTITGTNFDTFGGAFSVTFFDGVAAKYTINSTTSLTTSVPDGAATGPITVTNCKGSANTGTFTVTAPPPGTHMLSVTDAGGGFGTVTSDPAGIDCGSTCASSFTAGSTVTLTATAASGSTFAGWSGACSGTGDCTVTMNADHDVTATFTQNTSPPPPANCTVPNVVHERLFDALRAIRRRGCSVGKVTRITTTKRHVYYVIKQSPKHGKSVPAGTKVSVTAKTTSR